MQKTPRKPRSLYKLKRKSDHLFYEWQMLTRLEKALATNDVFLRNAFIESSAIHARNLTKFLYAYEPKNTPWDDDAIAEDYFPYPSKWQNARPKMPKILSYDKFTKYANRQIAHIVYTNQRKKQWNFTKIADAIQSALEKFVDMLPKGRLGNRWKTLLANQSGPRWDGLKRLVQGRA